MNTPEGADGLVGDRRNLYRCWKIKSAANNKRLLFFS